MLCTLPAYASVLAMATCLVLPGCKQRQAPPDPFRGPNPYSTTRVDAGPNILLLVADDLGYTDLGAFGGEIPTPHIDALAGNGMTLTNFHTAASCAPSRAMLLTGVDNHTAGLGSMTFMAPNQRGREGYEDHLTHRVVTLARLLRDAGYRTSMTGKWHLGKKAGLRPAHRGFDHSLALMEGAAAHFASGPGPAPHYYLNDTPWEPPGDFYSSDSYTRQQIQFLEQGKDSGQPFFAYVAYTAPHWPLQAPAADIARHQPVYRAGWDKVRAARLRRAQALGLAPADMALPPRPPEVPAWSALDHERQREEARKMAIYAAMVENLDRNVGRLMAYLERSGQLQNTLVVFLSDNGPDPLDIAAHEGLLFRLMSFGSNNNYENMGNADSFVSYGRGWADVSSTFLRGHKGLATEGGIRTPLILHWPGAISPGSSGHATSIVDLAPTVLEAAGIKHPGQRYRGHPVARPDGSSLWPLLNGERDKATYRPFFAYEMYGHQALIEGKWKALNLHPPYGDGTWQLFDLNADPAESLDVGAAHSRRLHRMIERHRRFREAKKIVLPPEDFNALSGDIGLWETLLLLLRS